MSATIYREDVVTGLARRVCGDRFLHAAERHGRLGVWAYDAAGDDFVFSAALAGVFGYAPHVRRVSLRDFLGRFHPEDRPQARRALRSVLEGGAAAEWEARAVRPDGSVRRLRCRAEPARQADGEKGDEAEGYLLGVCRDVTAEAEMEEELRHARRLRAAGEVASGVAHDLNNLLTVISGQAELLQAGLAPAEAALPEIRRACEHAAGLTGAALRFCRKGEAGLRAVDLGELVRQAEGLLRALLGKGIDLRVKVGPGRNVVRADPWQLEQALFNLAANARDAMPEGGELGLEVYGPPGAGDGRVVLLRCADTGCGMAEGVLARAFEPFFTTKPAGEGTGLGLSQVREAAREAGGHVVVRSEPGRGTTFEISLPQAQSPPASEGGPGSSFEGRRS